MVEIYDMDEHVHIISAYMQSVCDLGAVKRQGKRRITALGNRSKVTDIFYM